MNRPELKSVTGLGWPQDLAAMEAQLSYEGSAFVAYHEGLLLRTVFQPILSIAHQRPVAYEALLRVSRRTGAPVSPLDAFQAARGDAEAVHLDRLCRFLHVRNYLRFPLRSNWLFLNVDTRAIAARAAHSPFIGHLLDYFQIPGQQIVIEVLEGAIRDPERLTEAVEYFRSRGCLTAIDDFGAGHSNFDRLYRLGPDFVKLDRSLIRHGCQDRKAGRLLFHLVTLLHEIGALVIMEGVETEDEALLALDCGVDLIQGFLFGRPAPTPCEEPPPSLAAVGLRFRAALAPSPPLAAALHTALREALTRLPDSPLAEVASALCRTGPQQRILRCYILDSEGRQIEHHAGAAPVLGRDGRYAPLADNQDTQWFWRPYFRRALETPGHPQITRPYMSMPDAALCVTWACTYSAYGQLRVFCCDLEPPESPHPTPPAGPA